MHAEYLRALPRSALQKIAQTHQVRANGKTEAIINNLLERFPDGIPQSTATEPLAAASTSNPRAFTRRDAQRDGHIASDDEEGKLKMERSAKGKKAVENARKRLSAAVKGDQTGKSKERTGSPASTTVVDGETSTQVFRQPSDLSELLQRHARESGAPSPDPRGDPKFTRSMPPLQTPAPPEVRLSLSDALEIERELKAAAQRVTRAYATVSNLVSRTEDIRLKGLYVEMRTQFVCQGISSQFGRPVKKRGHEAKATEAETGAETKDGKDEKPRKRARTSVEPAAGVVS